MHKYLPFVLIIFLQACSEDNNPIEPGPITLASAEIFTVSSEDGENYTVGESMGTMSLSFQDSITTVEISVSNMEANTSHAMHLHLGTLETPDRHWNQNIFSNFCNERSLGEVWAKPFAGDVGNMDIDSDGNGLFSMATTLWSLGTGEDSDIVGTVLFIHQNEEDFITECDPNHDHQHGHTNAKIAGGTITLISTE